MRSKLLKTYTGAVSDSNPNAASIAETDASVLAAGNTGWLAWWDHTGDVLSGTITAWVYDKTAALWVALKTWPSSTRRALFQETTGITEGDSVAFQLSLSGATVDGDNPVKLYGVTR